jgi:hypothetical protein
MLPMPDPGRSQRPARYDQPVPPLAAVAAARGGFYDWLDGAR